LYPRNNRHKAHLLWVRRWFLDRGVGGQRSLIVGVFLVFFRCCQRRAGNMLELLLVHLLGDRINIEQMEGLEAMPRRTRARSARILCPTGSESLSSLNDRIKASLGDSRPCFATSSGQSASFSHSSSPTRPSPSQRKTRRLSLPALRGDSWKLRDILLSRRRSPLSADVCAFEDSAAACSAGV